MDEDHVLLQQAPRRLRERASATHAVEETGGGDGAEAREGLHELEPHDALVDAVEVGRSEDDLQLLLVALQCDGHARLSAQVQLIRLATTLRERRLEVAVLAHVHVERASELLCSHSDHAVDNRRFGHLAVRDEPILPETTTCVGKTGRMARGVNHQQEVVILIVSRTVTKVVLHQRRVDDEQKPCICKNRRVEGGICGLLFLENVYKSRAS